MAPAVAQRPGLGQGERFVEQFAAREARGGAVPSWLRTLRARGLEAFTAQGFPTTRDEEWLFTPVAPIAETAFVAGELLHVRREDLDGLLFGAETAAELVFVNGVFVPALSTGVTGSDQRSDPGVPGLEVSSLAHVLATAPASLEPLLGAHAGLDGVAVHGAQHGARRGWRRGPHPQGRGRRAACPPAVLLVGLRRAERVAPARARRRGGAQRVADHRELRRRRGPGLPDQRRLGVRGRRPGDAGALPRAAREHRGLPRRAPAAPDRAREHLRLAQPGARRRARAQRHRGGARRRGRRHDAERPLRRAPAASSSTRTPPSITRSRTTAATSSTRASSAARRAGCSTARSSCGPTRRRPTRSRPTRRCCSPATRRSTPSRSSRSSPTT